MREIGGNLSHLRRRMVAFCNISRARIGMKFGASPLVSGAHEKSSTMDIDEITVLRKQAEYDSTQKEES